MIAYNVFYSVKDGIEEEKVLKLTLAFIEQLLSHQLIIDASCQKLTNKANFTQMPDFHVSVNFHSHRDMDEVFSFVRTTLMETYPHSELMKSVKEFKVTFTEELRKYKEPIKW